MFRKLAARLYRPLRKLATTRPLEALKAARVFSNWAWAVAVYYEIIGMRRPGEVRFRGGGGLAVQTSDDLGCVWSCWIREEYRLTGEERIVVDAGANIGAFTVYAAARCPRARIVAFEPVEGTFAQLRDNVMRNRLEGRVRLVRAGVAAASGSRSISRGGKSPYSSLYRDSGGPREEIAVLGLGDLLAEAAGSGSVDFLKLDCEGAETDCLVHARPEELRRCARVRLEYHAFAGIPFAGLEASMRGAGFSRELLRDNGDGTALAWYARGN